jgi:hypothetical protein
LCPENQVVFAIGDALQVGNLKNVIWRAYDVALAV